MVSGAGFVVRGGVGILSVETEHAPSPKQNLHRYTNVN